MFFRYISSNTIAINIRRKRIFYYHYFYFHHPRAGYLITFEASVKWDSQSYSDWTRIWADKLYIFRLLTNWTVDKKKKFVSQRDSLNVFRIIRNEDIPNIIIITTAVLAVTSIEICIRFCTKRIYGRKKSHLLSEKKNRDDSFHLTPPPKSTK